jgi:hypothetical protein
LLRLTQPGEGTETTRRRASMAELVPTGTEASDVEEVVRRLVDARLITSSQDATGDVLDVAHEALIKGWPRLQSWVEENPAGLRLHRRLTEAVAEWIAAGRDPSYLFRGARLQEGIAWLEQNPAEPSATEQEFLEMSSRAAAAEQSARQRRIRMTMGSLIGVAAVLAVLAVVALVSWRTADVQSVAAAKAETAARARYLASEGARVSEIDPRLGLRLAIEGLALGYELEPPVDLTSDVRALATRGRILSLGEGIEELFASADGSTILLDRNGAAGDLRSGNDGRLIATLDREVESAAFSPTRVDYSVAAVGPVTASALAKGAPDATTVTATAVPTSTLVVLTYEDGGHEIRRLNGAPVDIPDGLLGVAFSSDPSDPIFLAWYESAPVEIRRVADGDLVRTLDAQSFGVSLVPDERTRFWVIHTSTGSSVILDTDGQALRETPEMAQIRDDGGPDANLLVCYEFAPGEIWSRVDGSVMATLDETCGGIDSLVRFDVNDRDLFEVWNSIDSPNAPTLYRLSDGAVVRRLKPIDGGSVEVIDGSIGLVTVSIGAGVEVRRDWGTTTIARLAEVPTDLRVLPGNEWFIVGYGEAPAELRSVADGRVALSFPGGFTTLSVSPDGSLMDVESGIEEFVVRLGVSPMRATDMRRAYFDGVGDGRIYIAATDTSSEIRRLADDEVITTLPGAARRAIWGPGWVYVDSFDGAMVVRLSDGRSVRVPSANAPPRYELDGSWPGLIMSRDDLRTSVWSLDPDPLEVYRSELGEATRPLGQGLGRFSTLTSDGRGYLVDMSWVRQIGGVASSIGGNDLVRAACAGPLSESSTTELEPYLGGVRPIACAGASS